MRECGLRFWMRESVDFTWLSNLLLVDFLCFKIKVTYSEFKSEFKITDIRYILF